MTVRPSTNKAGRCLLASTLSLSLLIGAGCGGARHAAAGATPAEVPPSYVTAPITPEQRLVERGVRLAVSDGCTACHLQGGRPTFGPNFASFAGRHLMLRNGRRALVGQHFLIEALSHPGTLSLRGYDPRPMVNWIARLGLAGKPKQVAALAAFIEQVGPEVG
ncbi:MAG TPA: hypothetical protein VGG08_05560 [Solirubrobacteraceae bacterium]